MRSMTGFGKSKFTTNDRIYDIEIRSVNHKYVDINVRLPKIISAYENDIKKFLKANITRGKIDVSIEYTNFSADKKNVVINHDLAKAYIDELKSLAAEQNLDGNIRAIDVAKMPDVLQVSSNESQDEEIKNELLQCLKEATNNFITMKNTEGDKIKQDLITRLDRIKKIVDEISANTTGLIEEYVVKLRERIKEILKTEEIDEARLAQETVIYADKSSIEEELTRLKSHIFQFNELLKEDKPIGKKLDFIIQEMNRELNTIASKSVKLEITNLVIDGKTELEDVREQVQNIE